MCCRPKDGDPWGVSTKQRPKTYKTKTYKTKTYKTKTYKTKTYKTKTYKTKTYKTKSPLKVIRENHNNILPVKRGKQVLVL